MLTKRRQIRRNKDRRLLDTRGKKISAVTTVDAAQCIRRSFGKEKAEEAQELTAKPLGER
jgi:hypothetical protein